MAPKEAVNDGARSLRGRGEESRVQSGFLSLRSCKECSVASTAQSRWLTNMPVAEVPDDTVVKAFPN